MQITNTFQFEARTNDIVRYVVIAGGFRRLGRHDRGEFARACERASLAGRLSRTPLQLPPSPANHARSTSFHRIVQKHECVSPCKRIPSLCGPQAVVQGMLRPVRLRPRASNDLVLPSNFSHVTVKKIYFPLFERFLFLGVFSPLQVNSEARLDVFLSHSRHPVVVSIVLLLCLNRSTVFVFCHVIPSAFISPYRTSLFRTHYIVDLLSTAVAVLSTLHIFAESTAYPLLQDLPSSLLTTSTSLEYHIDDYEVHFNLSRISH